MGDDGVVPHPDADHLAPGELGGHLDPGAGRQARHSRDAREGRGDGGGERRPVHLHRLGGHWTRGSLGSSASPSM